MSLRLVNAGWLKELRDALLADRSQLRIICPFIKVGALTRVLCAQPNSIRVITRFNLNDFADGVSDVAALRHLLKCGAQIRGIRHLHSKVYVFGVTRAIVTSANLTASALERNPEFGIVTQDPSNVADCSEYFEKLWARAGHDLTHQKLDDWDRQVRDHLGGRVAARGLRSRLPDFGANAGFPKQEGFVAPIDIVADAPQSFVKFLGEGNNRAPLTLEIVEEIRRAGCHRVLAYPATKRPSGVEDGAVMFIARLTSDPSDIRIFGRAIALHHDPRRDNATADEIALRSWKRQWPRYIRVHQVEFVAGTMANGISLNELMASLDMESFKSTQRNAELNRQDRGQRNTDPRKAYRQQAAVELTVQAHKWLAGRFNIALRDHGVVPRRTLAAIA